MTNAGPITSKASLALETLGNACLWSADRATTDKPLLDIGKPLALIIFVALSPGHACRREHLLDLLWADLEPDAAKHALRQTLWYIKKRVGDGLLVTTGDSITLAQPLRSDRDDLLVAAERGEHERVVALFAGDFLPRFAAPGGAEFEEWADVESRRLRAIFHRSAETRTRELLDSGRARDGVELARRARDLSPELQSSWRLLLEALVAAREMGGALLEADALEQMLQREEMEPEPATRAILRVVRQSRGSVEEPTTDERQLVGELVGREREFATILGAWEEAKGGHGRHLHLRAPAGLGKSRLLADLHARLRALRSRVAFVRCNLGARELPYALSSDLAAALGELPGARGISPQSASALVALNPSLSSLFSGSPDPATADEALRHRAVALRELTDAVSEDQPLAVLVDDVHWCDAASRSLLTQIASSISGHRVLLVTTGRPALEGQLESPDVVTIDLRPLDEGQVGALVTSIASLPAEPWAGSFAGELWHATSGSPLLVLETLLYLGTRDLLERDANGWRSPQPALLMAELRTGGALRRRLESLGRVERLLLLLLAAAGAPLDEDVLLETAAGAREQSTQALKSLEAIGLAARVGRHWQPAHDEIGTTALELASGDETRAAHSSLGRRYWHSDAREVRSLRLSAWHLAQAQDEALLQASFARFVKLMRSLGDTRRHHVLADDLLGSLSSDDRARRLVRSLPLHVRVGLTSALRVASVLSLFITIPLGFATFTTLLRTAAPDAELAVFRMANDSLADGYTIPVRLTEWRPGVPLTASGRPAFRFPSFNLAWPKAWDAARRRWILSATVADSGVIDLFSVAPDGTSERLTSARGDDDTPSLSPDSRRVVFETARWNPLSHYDLAILDLATRQVRQLTEGDPSDVAPVWGPQGSLIAFVRRYWDGRDAALCTVTPDGLDLNCYSVGKSSPSEVIGWLDAEEVAVIVSEGETPSLVSVNLQTAQVTPMLSGVGAVSISPDGQWLFCYCRSEGALSQSWIVAPTRRLRDFRPLSVGSSNTGRLHPAWMQRPTRYIDRVMVEHVRPTSPVMGVPYRLLARGITADGTVIDALRARWASLDTSGAQFVDSKGTFVGRRAGEIPILIDVGGWRSSRETVSVVPRAATKVDSIQWQPNLTADWLPFGTPQPTVVPTGRGFAFSNRGDGSFTSGVFSRRTFDSRQGVVLDAEVSAIITMPQWQSVTIRWLGAMSLEGLSQRALQAGDLSELLSRDPSTNSCDISYPAGGIGRLLSDSAAGTASEDAFRGAVSPKLRSGSWFTLRLQILPDGRCGGAIDGRPFFLSRFPVVQRDSLRLLVEGNSYNTTILVGPIRVTSGVPDDIDWVAFEREQDLRRASTSRPSITAR